MSAITHRKIHFLHHNCHDLCSNSYSTADSPVVKFERSRFFVVRNDLDGSEIRSLRSCQSVRQHTYKRTHSRTLAAYPFFAQFEFVCCRTDRRCRELYSHDSHFQADRPRHRRPGHRPLFPVPFVLAQRRPKNYRIGKRSL